MTLKELYFKLNLSDPRINAIKLLSTVSCEMDKYCTDFDDLRFLEPYRQIGQTTNQIVCALKDLLDGEKRILFVCNDYNQKDFIVKEFKKFLRILDQDFSVDRGTKLALSSKSLLYVLTLDEINSGDARGYVFDKKYIHHSLSTDKLLSFFGVYE